LGHRKLDIRRNLALSIATGCVARKRTERLGPLPLVNHFLTRLDLAAILARHVPTEDRRVAMPYADGLGMLLRSIVVEREPIYRQGETVRTFAAGLYGVATDAAVRLGDDQLGRALDRLFDADRAALLTEVVVAVGQRFGVRFAQLHNDWWFRSILIAGSGGS
jgi:hypothetical protein